MDMRNLLAATLLIASSVFAQEIPNPAIDMPGYLRISEEAASVRRACRVSEEEFRRIASQPGAVILDARSGEKYRELHVRGAVNLSFPDFTAANLQKVIASYDTPVLIYCNNNFTGAEGPFPGKMATASLNLSTYIALYTYGYRNVYELGPLVELRRSRLPFEGSGAPGR
jgi:Rhodanese-like domain